MYRCCLLVSALVLAWLVPVDQVVAHAGATTALPPHMVSSSAHGLTLTDRDACRSLPARRPRPRHGVAARDHGNNFDARVEECGGFLPVVQMSDSMGHLVNQPPIPTALTHPPCLDLTVPMPLPVGATLHWSGLVGSSMQHASVRQNSSMAKIPRDRNNLVDLSFELQTPDLSIRTLQSVRTRVTIQTSPTLHATVQVPPGGGAYYTDQTGCTAPYKGVITGGTTGWTPADGSTIEPSGVEGCTGISRWGLAVAVVGQSPVWIVLGSPRRPSRREERSPPRRAVRARHLARPR